MRQSGLSPEMLRANQPEPESVYPDNWPAVCWMQRLWTQWRIGMNGRTGLDYQGVQAAMDMAGLAAEERPMLFEELQIIESEMLVVWGRRGG